jgi:RNA polymerase sigma-B factor
VKNFMEQEIYSSIRRYQETESEEEASMLLDHFRSLVEMGAKKMSRNRPDLYEDLFQVGQMSLLRSLQKYDRDVGSPFEAYAMKSLVGHMKNYLRDKSWYIQVPRRIKEKGMHIQKAIDELTVQLKRSPEVKDIAKYLELSEEETIEILAGREYYQLASLDVPLSTDEGSAVMGDLVASKEDEYLKAENQMDLAEAMESLDQNEKKIIHMVFNDGLSQRDIADQLGISQMSVSRIQRKAVIKLREDLNIDHE